jgi:hypothetical protein
MHKEEKSVFLLRGYSVIYIYLLNIHLQFVNFYSEKFK